MTPVGSKLPNAKPIWPWVVKTRNSASRMKTPARERRYTLSREQEKQSRRKIKNVIKREESEEVCRAKDRRNDGHRHARTHTNRQKALCFSPCKATFIRHLPHPKASQNISHTKPGCRLNDMAAGKHETGLELKFWVYVTSQTAEVNEAQAAAHRHLLLVPIIQCSANHARRRSIRNCFRTASKCQFTKSIKRCCIAVWL